MSKKGLGKGLEAFIPNKFAEEKEMAEVLELKTAAIKTNEHQPRKYFTDEKTEELAQSIKEHGIIQPLIVKKVENNYFLIAGERRLLAAKKAGLEKVPCLLKQVSDHKVQELALIENIQRENLNGIEEAKAYRELMEMHGYKQEILAQKMGKSRSYIANMMRLLNLPKSIQDALIKKEISVGHGRCLLALEREVDQNSLIKEIIDKGLSVREVEKRVNAVLLNKSIKKKSKTLSEDDLFLQDLEERFRNKTGTKVFIKKKKKGGKIEIIYNDPDELEGLIEIFLQE